MLDQTGHSETGETNSGRSVNKSDRSVEMRDRRRRAGVVQMTFYVREADRSAIVRSMRGYTDLAWLSLFDAGAVLHGANEARAADIRARLDQETR